MRTRRKPSPEKFRRRCAAIAPLCALAGLGIGSRALAQQAPAPVTNLGTLVVTPTRNNAPTLAPAKTTVQRTTLKFQLQPGLPTKPQASPTLPAGARAAANGPQTSKQQPGLTIRTPPQALRIVAPKYPAAAIRKALRGSVTVGFTIKPNGHTGNIHIVSSQPADLFDQATLKAVRQWRFEPATVNGQPVATTVTQAIVFNPPLQQEQAPAPPPRPVPVQAAVAPSARPAPPKVQVHAVHIVAPKYPPKAYRQRIGGSVTLQFVVGTDGKTSHIHVIKADPPGIFNRAAKRAVRKWRFKPVETATTVTQTISFTPPGS